MGQKSATVFDVRKLLLRIVTGGARREELYDRLYAMRWGETTTNNYGFAPAEGRGPERFQMQLYTELLKLLPERADHDAISPVLEISCGRGGGLGHLARHLPRQTQIVGLDFSAHAIAFCRRHYESVGNLAFVRGHALQLPFRGGTFAVVVNVEASHAYGDDTSFLREVRRVLRPSGRFLFADSRTRRKMPRLEQLAHSAGLEGELRDITPNVVSACEQDAERRREIIRSGLPWYSRPMLAGLLQYYSGLPGTPKFERLRDGDRMYFLTCMTPRAPRDVA
jgi:ubiquinone/menaquinone biosynthesis C-methylase UbiE